MKPLFKTKTLLILTIVVFTPLNNLLAQSKVTFNVNMLPQLEDSSFVPGRDELKIVGNMYPIDTNRPYILTDTEPVDSVYSITIDFSSRFRGKTLEYNFEMVINEERQPRVLTEVMKRTLLLRAGEVPLDPLYFNAFAW